MARPALSANRATQVLNFLAAHRAPITMTELRKRLDINVASMHSILAVLEAAGYVQRDRQRRTYTLGPVVVALGSAALSRHQSIVHARHEMEGLLQGLGFTGAIAVCTGAEMVIVDEVVPQPSTPSALPYATGVGLRIPMEPPVGGIFMAWAEAEEVETWLDTATRPLKRHEREQIVSWLGTVRERGYAVGLEAPARQGVRRALRELEDNPGSRRARQQLERGVVNLEDLTTVAQALTPDATYQVAHVAAPLLDQSGEAYLGLYLMGMRHQTLSGADLERIGEALALVASRVQRTSAIRADRGEVAADHPLAAPALVW